MIVFQYLYLIIGTVVDSNPSFPVMKLMPGSEIYIAPKPRPKIVEKPDPEPKPAAPSRLESAPRKRALARIAAIGATFDPIVESFPQPDFSSVTQGDEDDEADVLLRDAGRKGMKRRSGKKHFEKGLLGRSLLPSEIWMNATDMKTLNWKDVLVFFYSSHSFLHTPLLNI